MSRNFVLSLVALPLLASPAFATFWGSHYSGYGRYSYPSSYSNYSNYSYYPRTTYYAPSYPTYYAPSYPTYYAPSYPTYYAPSYPTYYAQPAIQYVQPSVPTYYATTPGCGDGNNVRLQPQPVYQPTHTQTQTPVPVQQQTKEPPVTKASAEGPKVVESRSVTVTDGNLVQAVPNKDAGNQLCKVGFWNVSTKEVRLQVDGKSHTIPSNKNLTIAVPRQFTYQVDDLAPVLDRVADDKTSADIVIR